MQFICVTYRAGLVLGIVLDVENMPASADFGNVASVALRKPTWRTWLSDPLYGDKVQRFSQRPVCFDFEENRVARPIVQRLCLTVQPADDAFRSRLAQQTPKDEQKGKG